MEYIASEMTKEELLKKLKRAEADLENYKVKYTYLKVEMREHEEVATQSLKQMRALLRKWTNRDQDRIISKTLRFNRTDKKIEMISALMDYLHTSDIHLFDSVVHRRMLRVMCVRIDEYRKAKKKEISNL